MTSHAEIYVTQTKPIKEIDYDNDAAAFVAELISRRILQNSEKVINQLGNELFREDLHVELNNYVAYSLVEIFGWSKVDNYRIEEVFSNLTDAFLEFMLSRYNTITRMYFEPFDDGNSMRLTEVIYFYNEICRKYSEIILAEILTPLIQFAKNAHGGGVSREQFTKIAEAKHSHMKDMPVEWIIEVLV